MANHKPSNLWKAGQSGNPAGRPPGRGVISRLRELLEPDAPEILQTMVAAAKSGDVQAARLILERILPPIKAVEGAENLLLEGDTLSDQGKSVLRAISDGFIAPSVGVQIIGAVGALARVVEIDELERRISQLEGENVKT